MPTDDAYTVEEVPFTACDQLLQYTHGVSETRHCGGNHRRYHPNAATACASRFFKRLRPCRAAITPLLPHGRDLRSVKALSTPARRRVRRLDIHRSKRGERLPGAGMPVTVDRHSHHSSSV